MIPDGVLPSQFHRVGRRRNRHREKGQKSPGLSDVIRFVLSGDAAPRSVPYPDKVINVLRSLLAEPRATPPPPVRVWRDWALVGVLLVSAVLEGLLRPDVVWRPVALTLTVGLLFTLLWRRSRPLEMVQLAFGAVILLDIAALIANIAPAGLNTMAFLLLLPYSLFRWGSGRELALGSMFMVAAGILGVVTDYNGLVEAVLGWIVLLFAAVLGSSIRYRATSRFREIDQVKLREREQLARELHDTVAHHVSAIAIRAQAGRAVAASDPEGALDALSIIETEASRTLAEMRRMVGVLRQDDEIAGLAPQRRIYDIERLAKDAGDRPKVDVELSGEIDTLGPSLDATIYRLAQESITNALRHARNATRVTVTVSSESDCVRLVVSDDGEAVLNDHIPPGYGLIGMTERANLLGGTLEAGPATGRGWTVVAVLPRTGAVA